MRKLFISQPMKDKTYEQIISERRIALQTAMQYLNEEVEVIDSVFRDIPKDVNPLWCLGQALKLMSTADVVYFADGWQNYRGCKIEHDCAEAYGLRIL